VLLRSVLAAGQAADKVALQECHRTAQEEVRRRFRPYPDLEQWHRDQRHPELAANAESACAWGFLSWLNRRLQDHPGMGSVVTTTP